MQKKFLRTFAILVTFIGVLGPIGITNAYGMYTEALEHELTSTPSTRLACQQISMGYLKYSDANDEPAWEAHECAYCDKYKESAKRYGPPLFEIERSGIRPKVIITYTRYCCIHPVGEWEYLMSMCHKPQLTGKMQRIWDKAEIIHEHRCGFRLSSEKSIGWQPGLESLWAAASILDQCDTDTEIDLSSSSTELTQYSLPEIVFVYPHECGCCTII